LFIFQYDNIIMDPAEYLPGELWQGVLEQLEPSTLLLGRLVSKGWCRWIDDRWLWKKICQDSYEPSNILGMYVSWIHGSNENIP
jgi:hypothetical protein